MLPNLLLSLLAATSSASAAPAPAPSQLVVSFCEAGEHFQFETAKCSIELRNTGEKPIHISDARPLRSTDSIQGGTITVAPNGTAYIEAKIDLRNQEGFVRHPFQFKSDERGQELRGSEARAFVMSILDQAKPKIDFGVIRLGAGELPSSKSVTLSSREAKDFRITRVESSPAWLDVSVDADGRTVRATPKGTIPWGLTHNGAAYVKLALNAPQQPHAWVEIEANVFGDIVPDSDPFQLGMMRSVGKHEYLQRVTSPAGKDFKVGKLTVTGIKGSAKAEVCVPAAAGCKLVRLSVDNDQQLGKLEGKLAIELPELGKTLPIEVLGLLLAPETKIHKLEEMMEKSEAGSTSKAATPSVNIGTAIQSAIKQEEPPPAGTGPLLKWSVAHQTPIYGYLIYRSDSEAGPLLRINKDVILIVKDGTDDAGTYQWRDNSAESGKTYWYQIGILNKNGSREDLTGKQKVVAK